MNHELWEDLTKQDLEELREWFKIRIAEQKVFIKLLETKIMNKNGKVVQNFARQKEDHVSNVNGLIEMIDFVDKLLKEV